MHLGDVLLHLVEATGEEGDVAVALPVHHALLERGEGFGPRKGDRIGPPRLVAGEEHGALRHPELHPPDVVQVPDGFAGV